MNNNKLQMYKIIANRKDIMIDICLEYKIIDTIDIDNYGEIFIGYKNKEIYLKLNNWKNEGIKLKEFKNLKENNKNKTQDDIEFINNVILFLSSYKDKIERKYDTTLIDLSKTKDSILKLFIYDDFNETKIFLDVGCVFYNLYIYNDNVCKEVYSIYDKTINLSYIKKIKKEDDYNLYTRYNYINNKYSNNQKSFFDKIRERIDNNSDIKKINETSYKLEKPIVDKSYIKITPDLKEEINNLNKNLKEAYTLNILNDNSIIKKYYIPEINKSLNDYDNLDYECKTKLKENIDMLSKLVKTDIEEYKNNSLTDQKLNINIMNEELKKQLN